MLNTQRTVSAQSLTRSNAGYNLPQGFDHPERLRKKRFPLRLQIICAESVQDKTEQGFQSARTVQSIAQPVQIIRIYCKPTGYNIERFGKSRKISKK